MALGNRASQHNFARVPSAQIPRSKFDRSFGRKQTFDADYLVPVFLDEVLPGDTFNLRLTTFARLATPIAPFMDNLYMDYFFFFVPNRLIWENWQRFNGEQDDPGDSTDFITPSLGNSAGFEGPISVGANTIFNYMGLPEANLDTSKVHITSLPFRAYNLIWNEWFRDQNLQNSVNVPKDDGPDILTDFQLLKRGKRHDYFTSALPWPQKGPSVELPLGNAAPVGGMRGDGQWYDALNPGNTSSQIVYDMANPSLQVALTHDASGFLKGSFAPVPDGVILNTVKESREHIDGQGVYDHRVTLAADLSEATAATINQLREAFQIQRLYERDARGGTRYTEIIKSHFGVVSPDARLQRPEYLGGGRTTVNINPIAQTSSTDATTPQGNLAAFGTSTARQVGFNKSFTEHGFIIGLVAARADLSYQQGVNKLWNRKTRFDYYWPTLSHLGEQAIMNSEIYIQGTDQDKEVFGYQERYAEYRYKPSEILGTFASQNAQSLDIWHLAQDFQNLPVLNSSFIQSDTPINRVIAVPTEPHFLWDGYFKLICARPMPTYSVPGMIDHF